MGPQLPQQLLDLLVQCTDADLGTLHESRGVNGIALRTRKSLYNQTALVSLDYNAGHIAPPFEPQDDDQLTRNDITVERTIGGAARAELATGRMSTLNPEDGGVGRYDTAITVNVYDEGQLPDIAGWLLHLGTVDETRYPTVRINLANPTVSAHANLPRTMLDINVDDRFTITNPKTGQTPDTIAQLARGYTEYINAYEHHIELNGAPESPYQVLTLDADTAKLSSDGSELAEDITTTETAWDIAVTDGPLWTTDAGQMPISLMVSGEAVSVTAISGASSPQTFTVTRSLNGVVKTHVTGTPIRLLRPATLGL
jgi:hypothetical protein